MAHKKRNKTNTMLLALGLILIVVDGLVMSLPGLSDVMIRIMLIVSIIICGAIIGLMTCNIIREGKKIKSGEQK